jgi:TPR repeat protein
METINYLIQEIKKRFISCKKMYYSNIEEKDKFDYQILGNIYFYESSVEPDYEKALNMYLKCVEFGLQDSQTFFNIGYIYYSGNHGVDINYNEAYEWFKKSLFLGNKESLYYLATLYLHGFGCERNINKAISIFRMSGEIDNCVLSQHDLGMIYEHGFEDENKIYIQPNLKEAMKWHKLAANNGCFKSTNQLANLIFENENIEETCYLNDEINDKEIDNEFKDFDHIEIEGDDI